MPQRGCADGRRSLTTRQSIMNQAPRKKYSLGNRQHTTAKHDIPDQPDAKPAAPDRHCRNHARIHSTAKRSPCSPCALAPAQHRTFSLIQVSYTRKIRHAERKCRAPQSWSRPQGATRCAHWMLRIDFCCRISQSAFPDTYVFWLPLSTPNEWGCERLIAYASRALARHISHVGSYAGRARRVTPSRSTHSWRQRSG